MSQTEEPIPIDVSLDAAEQKFNLSIEAGSAERFNRLPNPKQLIVLAAGSAVVVAFMDELSSTGSTTKAGLRAGAEIGGKAVTAVARLVKP
ncbi:hypothetical protein A3D14_03170 [Candidatus Saccharibacteria bacterium RIFCSPHIGHO2_02_FULL_47_12]|nr:MAG: hypothetical protein A3D14_03170 [Candidatus Saccharibacteria bacterium RIFCSPHIGHO2_02_FULL_47_12]